MSKGEFFTRMTIWISLCGYALGAGINLLAKQNDKWQLRARWAWTIACLALLVHVVCAFHFYHNWSHASAYLETARQTGEVTGSYWGGGLFINYIFIAIWVLDTFWQWRGIEAYRQRPLAVTIIWQSILIFMVFNATVVFKTGLLRWLGLALCLGLTLLWCFTDGRKALYKQQNTSVMIKD
jgi:hypothetical protein